MARPCSNHNRQHPNGRSRRCDRLPVVRLMTVEGLDPRRVTLQANAVGCIALRVGAKSPRRTLLEISDEIQGKLQRSR